MTQRNTQHHNHKKRKIRRVDADGGILAAPIPIAVPPAPQIPPSKPGIGQGKVDTACLLSGAIVDDYDVILNQTDIGGNHNKFYVAQIVRTGTSSYNLFTKWGRVGEPGETQLKWFPLLGAAVADFKEKFKSKTQNDWENRDAFVVHKGKYSIVEMCNDCDQQVDTYVAGSGPTEPCQLDNRTRDLIEFIFSNNMFK